MNKFFIAKKWSKSSDFTNCRIVLFRYDPTTQSCYPDGKRSTTVGQMLCHIGCEELGNWNFVGQTTVCGFTATCYKYPTICGKEDVKVIVIEYCPPDIFQSSDELEHHDNDSQNKTGGATMKEHQFKYSLNPSEFQAIYHLLGDAQAELEKTMQSNDLSDEVRKSKASQYETIQNLTARIRRDMDDYLLHYPLHAYSQWRMAQLRNYAEEIIKLFDLEDGGARNYEEKDSN